MNDDKLGDKLGDMLGLTEEDLGDLNLFPKRISGTLSSRGAAARLAEKERYWRAIKEAKAEAKTKTIGAEPTKKKKRKKNEFSIERIMNLVTKASSCAAIIGMLGLSVFGLNYLSNKNMERNITKAATSIAVKAVETKLIIHGLATDVNGKFKVNDNDKASYDALITGVNPPREVIYAYKLVLPREEFCKFIQTISYVDSNGQTCNCLSPEQYYKMNGFVDSKTKIPDSFVFDNYMETSYYRHSTNNSLDTIINYINNGRETEIMGPTLFEQPYIFTSTLSGKGRGR